MSLLYWRQKSLSEYLYWTQLNRIEEIDALRGIALMGILVVNIFVFHAPYSHYGEVYGSLEGTQRTILYAMIYFFSGKFMLIYSFLFGYSLGIMKERYKDNFLRTHLGRMVVLLM
ncbi:MAG: hypothetical protein HRT74_04605, partial [Flavobacteriales bacterium]|nr:hypothetical protein [Flavobacteriales bacterium]